MTVGGACRANKGTRKDLRIAVPFAIIKILEKKIGLTSEHMKDQKKKIRNKIG